ncbi:hypothetical protein LCGC14_0448550 [marine sediment metagenome]|uniref:Uncharacterized protein n=1 Tax=marine sediment metagenome TaxID=412755 RepID=A0A0F9SNW6_9ZZZZ
MATGETNAPSTTLPAATALAAAAVAGDGQFCAVSIDTAGRAKLGDGSAGTPETLIGILQNKPKAIGQAANIQTLGVSKGRADAAFSIGDDLSAKSDGKLATAVATDIAIAVALEAATAEDEVVSVFIHAPYEVVTQ